MNKNTLTPAEVAAITSDLAQEPARIAAERSSGLFIGRGLRTLRSDSRADYVDAEGVEYRRLTPERWKTIITLARDWPEKALEKITTIEAHIRELVAAGYLDAGDFFPGGELPQ